MHVHSPQVDQDLVVSLVWFHMDMQFCIYTLCVGSIQPVVHLYTCWFIQGQEKVIHESLSVCLDVALMLSYIVLMHMHAPAVIKSR